MATSNTSCSYLFKLREGDGADQAAANEVRAKRGSRVSSRIVRHTLNRDTDQVLLAVALSIDPRHNGNERSPFGIGTGPVPESHYPAAGLNITTNACSTSKTRQRKRQGIKYK